MLVKVVVAVPLAGMLTVAVRVVTEPEPSCGGDTEIAVRTVAPVGSGSSVTVLMPFSTVSGRQEPAATETGVALLMLNKNVPVTLPFLQMTSVEAPSPSGADPATSSPELVPRVMASVRTTIPTVPNTTESHRLPPIARDVLRANIRWVSSLARSRRHRASPTTSVDAFCPNVIVRTERKARGELYGSPTPSVPGPVDGAPDWWSDTGPVATPTPGSPGALDFPNADGRSSGRASTPPSSGPLGTHATEGPPSGVPLSTALRGGAPYGSPSPPPVRGVQARMPNGVLWLPQ